MQKKTHLGRSVEKTAHEAAYDANAKELLSDKQILAWIMKYSVSEFEAYRIEDIVGCIEGTPEVSTISLYPGRDKLDKNKLDRITGIRTESKISGEGEVTFDIRFYAITPGEERIKIILNVEAQKKYRVGYHLVSRGIFYCARMLSEQMDTEFTAEDYDNIKKVYSIWICLESPEKVANTITEYKMCQNDIYGNFAEKEKYDLLSVIMVRLSKNKNVSGGSNLHEMLTILFSDELDADMKKEELQNKYQLKMTEQLKGGISSMCNLSELIREEGIEIGQETEKCNTIRRLSTRMEIAEIVQTMQYDETFVTNVIELIQEYPNATDEEIARLCADKSPNKA